MLEAPLAPSHSGTGAVVGGERGSGVEEQAERRRRMGTFLIFTVTFISVAMKLIALTQM
jgi:hypothetical protein